MGVRFSLEAHMITAKQLQSELKRVSDSVKAKILAGFFKTGKGEYGEGDKFIGVTIPKIRKLAKLYFRTISLSEIGKIIHSPIHEERLLGLIILTYKFPRVTPIEQEKIYKFYLKNLKYINNWDLIDLTADRIVGEYLKNKDKIILIKLANSKILWHRRIAIIATFNYIKSGDATWTLKIAEILLNDHHDLIHKAVGWMLREIGKRIHPATEEKFLQKYYPVMPRTMLRYAIERFPEETRQWYLKKPIHFESA